MRYTAVLSRGVDHVHGGVPDPLTVTGLSLSGYTLLSAVKNVIGDSLKFNCAYPEVMPIYQKKDVSRLLAAIKKDEVNSVYLLFGERFLCRDVADKIIAALLPDEGQRASNVREIDGDRENPGTTMNLLKSYSLFPGHQVFRVTDTRLFLSKNMAKSFWVKAEKLFSEKKFDLAGRQLGKMFSLAGLKADDEISSLAAGRWKTLFGFAKPQEVNWVKKVELSAVSDNNSQSQGAEIVENVFRSGIPPRNILILTAEAVDKRKKLFKFIKKTGVIIDLAVDSGATAAARRNQDNVVRELIIRTLRDFQKKIEPRAMQLLMERVGFHPVAAVNETEKLALYAADSEMIVSADVEAITGRTREEALFEFTEAFAGGNLAAALGSLDRLRENGIHSLMIVAGLRNFIRKLLVASSILRQSRPAYSRNMSYPVFQKTYLPQLKESRDELPPALSGHPYVVYKTFFQAEKFSLAQLKQGLALLLETELEIKSSGIRDNIVLENFLFGFMMERNKNYKNLS